MDTVKARETLGLNINYSDKDLVDAYKKLAKKNHSDIFLAEEDKRKADERFKEINEAFDFLKRNSIGFVMQKINASLSFYTVNGAVAGDYEDIFNKYKIVINSMIERYKERLSLVNDVATANAIFQEFKDDVLGNYNAFKDDMFKSWNIDVPNIQKYLNYECSLKDFLLQLEEVKNQEVEKQEQKFRDEVYKYKLWPYYEFLANIIDDIVASAFANVRKNEKLREQIIEGMHEDIKRVFAVHVNVLGRFKRIEDYFVSIYGENAFSRIRTGNLRVSEEEYRLIFAFDMCFNDYNSGRIFYNCDAKLKAIEKKFASVKMRLDSIKMKAEMQSVFELVTKRFYERMQELNVNLDIKAIEWVNDTYQRFIRVYKLVMEAKISISNMDSLRNLTFRNVEEDQTLFNSLDIQENKWQNLKLYINKQDKILYALNERRENSAFLVGFSLGQFHQLEVPIDEFDRTFISLDEFLDNATFMGEKNTAFGYDALFKLDGCILIRDDNTDEKYQILSFSDYFNFSNETVDEKYADKRFIKNEIIKAYSTLFNREMVRS